jgi:hypothetical protein
LSAPAFDFRKAGLRVIAGGLTLGALGWFLAGRANVEVTAPDPPPSATGLLGAPSFATDLNALRASPLFALPVGQDAAEAVIAQADLHVLGVVSTPERHAALVAGGGETPTWVVQGRSFHGFTLIDVQPNQATFSSSAGDPISVNVFASPADRSLRSSSTPAGFARPPAPLAVPPQQDRCGASAGPHHDAALDVTP